MDINLESCFVGFLIGFALYLLVNRVFMVEGMDSNAIEDTRGCQAACDTKMSGQELTCEWVENCSKVDGGTGCNIGGIHENCRACGGVGYSSCLSPSPSPSPSKVLTEDELKLKGIIEAAIKRGRGIHPSVFDSAYEWRDPMVKGPPQQDDLTHLSPHVVVNLFFDKNEEDSREFKRLLQGNSKKLVDSYGNSILLMIIYGEGFWALYNQDQGPTVGETQSIANCFNDDIIGISVPSPIDLPNGPNYNYFADDLSSLADFSELQYLNTGRGFGGDLSHLSGLNNLQYLRIADVNITGKLSALSGLNGLKFLKIDDVNITGNLSALKGLKQLQHLEVGNDALKGNLSALKDLTELQFLEIRLGNLAGSIEDLKMLGKLTFLSLGNDYRSSRDSVLVELSDFKDFNQLILLDLSDLYKITGSLSDLTDLKTLKYLDLSPSGWPGDYYPSLRNIEGRLSDLKDLTELEFLDLCPNSNIYGDVFEYDNLKNLYLGDNTDFDECDGITGGFDIDCRSDRFNCSNCSE